MVREVQPGGEAERLRNHRRRVTTPLYWSKLYLATAKEEIRRLIDILPDNATWEDVQYSIYVKERIERARREADDGNIIQQDEIESRMEQWLVE